MADFWKELSSWSCILIPLLLVIVGFIIAGISVHCNKKELDSKTRQQREQLSKKGIVISQEYEWRNAFNSRYYRFLVDEVHKKIYLESNTSKGLLSVPFSKLVGFETYCDSLERDSVRRAIVGGAVYGPMGVVIGAHSARNKVKSFGAVLYIADLRNSSYEFNLIQNETSTKSIDYTGAVYFVNKVNASVKAIIAMNG